LCGLPAGEVGEVGWVGDDGTGAADGLGAADVARGPVAVGGLDTDGDDGDAGADGVDVEAGGVDTSGVVDTTRGADTTDGVETTGAVAGFDCGSVAFGLRVWTFTFSRFTWFIRFCRVSSSFMDCTMLVTAAS
jgi:hypothetical protein